MESIVSKFDKEDSKMIKAWHTATFYNKKKVELNGNARSWKGGYRIKGRKIIYDIKTSMISVDEARGVVQPGELEMSNPLILKADCLQKPPKREKS